MSLLQSLSYKDYQKALLLTVEQCEILANLANVRHLTFEGSKKPGEQLLKNLDRRGFALNQYKELISSLGIKKNVHYEPNVKVAILIGNDKYVYLSKLATPNADCSALSRCLKNLGFNVVLLKNTTARALKAVLKKLFSVIPQDSYCVVFYAGHGCEVNNTTCMLGVDCPTADIGLEHCIPYSYVLSELVECKLELCVFIMDMCRISLDSEKNPQLYAKITKQDKHTSIKNFIICYSTQSSQRAYEAVQLYCSETLDNVTYELNTCDLDAIVPESSLYGKALCKRLTDDTDVSSMLDKVHEEVENTAKHQKPIKIQHGDARRSLHDPCKGDMKTFLNKLKEIGKEFYEVI